MNCPAYRVPFHGQLSSGDPHGGTNCTAWSASYAVNHATCGAKSTTGTYIRRHSSEPTPDPKSPGLNLPQVAAVTEAFGVHLDVRIGLHAVTWAEYERRRADGQGALLQVGYGPIADSQYDAGRGFRANHCIYEDQLGTYDPLADGRAAGVWTFDGRLYSRAVVRAAAATLLTSPGTHPRSGTVWAAFTRDVVPQYRVIIKPIPPRDVREFADYKVTAGVIVGGKRATTSGLDRPCTAPAWYKDARPGQGGVMRRLVSHRSPSGVTHWASAGYSVEV